jgi:FtsP/CotA-like multicopper oxidase with cupredoxin domain
MRRRWRAVVVAAMLIAGVGGYAAIPQQPAVASTGVILGDVPTAVGVMSATIVIGRDAATRGYSTKVVTISQGGTLNVVNEDSIQHTVTSVGVKSSGLPLFDHYTDPGSTTSIAAASRLAPGRYQFYCRFHPTAMRGTLVVEKGIGGGGGTRPAKLKYEQPLKLPKVLTGSHIKLPVRRAKVRVLPHGPKTTMWTYGGSYPGPTIRRPAGRDTKVTYINNLPRAAGAITVHLHGDHHPWQDDGQTDRFLIRHHGRRTYDYPLTDHGKPETEAFDWYHDHRMNETSRNNWHGLQGMFQVTDNREKQLRLPTGRRELPLMFSDRSFTKRNQLTDPFKGRSASMTGKTGAMAPPGDGVVGRQVLVDGRFAPYLKVAEARYRLQLVNSSTFETYDFALSNGQSFVQVGTGDSLLPKPAVRQDILLGPSQRADVIVDFHGQLHKHVLLQSISQATGGPVGVGSPTASLMQFRVTHPAAVDRSRIPPRLQQPPPLHAPKKVSATWTFGLAGNSTDGSYWTVDGKPFDPRRVDVEVPLGARQTWLLKNTSSVTHFIHLHEEQWHTIKVDGRKPPPWERGLEDTWRIDPGGSVEVAARFTDYTGVFMVHCHMLVHEDDGMMAQFAVVKPGTHKLPHGYSHRTVAAKPAGEPPMQMSMQMAPADPGAAASFTDWSRVAIRATRAMALELSIIALALGWRRYRRYAAAGI